MLERGWLANVLKDATKCNLAHAIATVAPDETIKKASAKTIREAKARLELERNWIEDFLS